MVCLPPKVNLRVITIKLAELRLHEIKPYADVTYLYLFVVKQTTKEK